MRRIWTEPRSCKGFSGNNSKQFFSQRKAPRDAVSLLPVLAMNSKELRRFRTLNLLQ
jgi:hypothetical protein